MVIVNVDDSLDYSVDVSSVNSDMTAKYISNESHTDIIDDENDTQWGKRHKWFIQTSIKKQIKLVSFSWYVKISGIFV
jgi:hypothetical protein